MLIFNFQENPKVQIDFAGMRQITYPYEKGAPYHRQLRRMSVYVLKQVWI